MLPDLPALPPAQTLEPPALHLKLSHALRRSSMLPGQHLPPTAKCVAHEAERHNLDPLVLLAVLKVEGGKPGELALNRNGTFDLGPMSINTVWLPELARRHQVPEREMASKLASDGCTNVAAAAWILQGKIRQAGSVWEGVANYHSANPKLQGAYLNRVLVQFERIVQRFAAGLR
jgi:hypothetical protein